MLKKLLFLTIFLLAVSNVYAEDLLVRVGEPKSPTGNNSFNINFVVLDIQNRAAEAKCYKKGPDDLVFLQFDKTYNLSSGGESQNCVVTADIIKSNGEYQFYVEVATEGKKTVSNTVKVLYNSDVPDAPINFSKEKIDSCKYSIGFLTANDSGKTEMVKLYRSEALTFIADSLTEVATLNLGSNQQGSFLDKVPSCDKTYYYALRSFNKAGNGSVLTGDIVIKYVTVEVTPAPTASNKYSNSVNNSTGNTNSGNQQTFGDINNNSEILGESKNESSSSSNFNTLNKLDNVNGTKEDITAWFNKLNPLWLIIVLMLLSIYPLYRRFRR